MLPARIVIGHPMEMGASSFKWDHAEAVFAGFAILKRQAWTGRSTPAR